MEKLVPRDPDADYGGVDDMTKLTYLNEPGVLYNLARRYALNEIYVSKTFLAEQFMLLVQHSLDGIVLSYFNR